MTRNGEQILDLCNKEVSSDITNDYLEGLTEEEWGGRGLITLSRSTILREGNKDKLPLCGRKG